MSAPIRDLEHPTTPAARSHETPLLEISELGISFSQYSRGLRKRELHVISDLSLHVHFGQMVAIVGSSGSGKSLLANAIMGILPKNAQVKGRMFFKGEPLTDVRRRQLRGSQIAYIPQSVDCLDPLMRVGAQVRGRKGTKQDADRALARHGLDPKTGRLYPFELSGGMARRVLLATEAMTEADLIVADEPTPGLTRDLALAALRDFRAFADEGKGVLLITHDLALACEVADQVVVFYGGQTLEAAPAGDFRVGRAALRHPYSKALWRALPQHGFEPIPGTQPYAGTVSRGCIYAPRCPKCDAECLACEKIPVRDVRGGEVRCIHAV